MLQHFKDYILHRDQKRVDMINAYHFSENGIYKGDVLYIDGEGTLSGVVAEAAADFYVQSRKSPFPYPKVVMAGGKIPSTDPLRFFTHGKLKRYGHALAHKGETEAGFIKRAFTDKVALLGETVEAEIICIEEGGNAGAKAKACKDHFKDAACISAVTLAYSKRRLHGTLRKELGSIESGAPAISAYGVFPFNITCHNWQDWWLSYVKVMDEADKTGPRFDGLDPAYTDFFEKIDPEIEKAYARSRVQNISFT